MKVKLLSGMVNFCCVPLCHSRSTRDETSFRFPSKEREPERHVAWVRAIRRENFVVKEHTRVCGLHFPPGAFKEDEGGNFFFVEGRCNSFHLSHMAVASPSPVEKKATTPSRPRTAGVDCTTTRRRRDKK